ncbi:amidohydrolase [Planctomycetales bacterium ZRK34]|nr:amidohydrolase [Planctomycetales bacterium ZRK34]
MQTQTAWAEQLDRAIDDLFDPMVALRRHLHMHPEPSGSETHTTEHLRTLLSDAGFKLRLGPEDRGLIVDPADPPQAPRIGLRADIDALRIADAKDVSYRSQTPGVMHACGHDGHSAIVFGAIMALDAVQKSGLLPWPVNWRAIFQPAEETCIGALAMVEAGAVVGVEALLGVHMDPTRPVGTVGLRAGAFTADCDAMEIDIIGRGGHAARPHESLDPIAAAAQLISSIYLFVPRAVESYTPVVVTIGQIIGGDSHNVIPDRVHLEGTLRSADATVRQAAVDHIQQLARGLATASGTRIDVKFHHGPPAVFNDSQLTGHLRFAATQLLGADHVQSIPRPSMGGEDFANYLAHVPGAMFRLGCNPPQVDSPAMLHSPLFDLDERALAIGAKILARAAVRWAKPT